MKYRTVEVVIDRGRIVPCDPSSLPESGNGLLTIFDNPPASMSMDSAQRVQLPLIHGNGEHLVNPSPEDLDASLWDKSDS